MTYEEQKISQEQIAASLAHEIRNPLALIRSNLQLVQLDDHNSTHKKSYDMIYREIDRINNIVVNYMESAKPLKADFACFDIRVLIEEIKFVFLSSFLERQIPFTVDSQESIEIYGDFDRLKQVLINVVQNAKESIAPERKDGSVSIHVHRAEDFAIINVSDNGSGISEYNLSSIGTPFFTTKEDGTGLGINISRGIIKLHGGSFNIAGIEGRGTTVSISLPLATDENSSMS